MEPVSDEVMIEEVLREIDLNRQTPALFSSPKPNRILGEIRKYFEDVHHSDGLVLEFADDLKTVTGYIQVLDEDSPYYGGCFVVEALIPEGYPYKAPKIRFLTKIWHPSVDILSGNFCLGASWSPAFTVYTLFQALQIAISNPEAEDPLELAIGKQMVESPEVFQKTAKLWTKKYASQEGSSIKEYEQMIKQRVDETDEDKDFVILEMSLRGWTLADEELGDCLMLKNTSAALHNQP